MNAFRLARACDADPLVAMDSLLAGLEPVPSDTHAPGLLYLNHAAMPVADTLLSHLAALLPHVEWAGACAEQIIAGGEETDARPTIVAMLIDSPRGAWQMIRGPAPLRAGIDSLLIHADPTMPELPRILRELSAAITEDRLVGGLTGGIGGLDEQLIGHDRVSGGLTGVGFDRRVRTLSRVTQGCAPLAGEHTVTRCRSHFVQQLDGLPALDVLLADLGVDHTVRDSRDGDELLAALPAERLRQGLLVGLSDRPTSPRGFDYLVRNLVGIDPENRLLAVAADPQEGDRLVFCTRDREAARADLIRVCTEIRDEIESEGLTALGTHYVSCVARGAALFGTRGAEAALLQHNLGGIPLVGFYANGEIAGRHLYGHTGVLTVFVTEASDGA